MTEVLKIMVPSLYFEQGLAMLVDVGVLYSKLSISH